MAYFVFLGDMICPVTPSKIDTKIKGQNKTLTLINDGEINMLKAPGLTEISFDLLLPNAKYPFAVYDMKKYLVVPNADYYINKIERLKTEKKPFQFIVTRTKPNNQALFDTNIKVSLEDYTIKEDKKEGFDFVVTVKLKQYKEYGTKIYNGTGTLQPTRSTENSPEAKTHHVKPGDTLWNIAKYYYDNGSKYTIIYEANKSIIGGNPNLIYPGQVLTIPDVSGKVATGGGSLSVNKKPKYTLTINAIFDALEGYTVRAGYKENNKFVYKTLIENTIDGEDLGFFKRTSHIALEKGTEVVFHFISNLRTSIALVGDDSWIRSPDGEELVFATTVDKNKEVTITPPYLENLAFYY